MIETQMLTITVEGRDIQAALADGGLWFPQASLARLFETTSQNVTIHISNLSRHMDISEISRQFAIVQAEGKRRVCRKVKVYGLEIAHAIGIRAQRFAELNRLMEVARELGVATVEYRIIPILERDFGRGLTVLLRGIAKVERQVKVSEYRIDFYLPEFALAVEFDELHHERGLQRILDKKRQRDIEKLHGINCIRVTEGREFEGINLILRHILSRRTRM
jgi:very-short-patch-repair endonuclease